MFVGARGSDRGGLESIEDQVSTDIRNIVQAPKSDLVAKGVDTNLLEMAKRVGPQYEATEHENLHGDRKVSPWTTSLWTIEGAIEPFVDGIVELSMKAPMSVSKPADLE